MIERLGAALTGRYAIEREIGRGGMATVYLARDERHERNVALKILSPELGAVLGAERFLAEIKVTANLQHPNLLPLFDSGEADGLLYYVMPFVEGESLRARLDRERQLPVDEAVHIGVAVARALDYAHSHGVIHRDLKPENILLQHGQPMIADFGIALAVSNAGGNRITQTGLSLGTPQYMSPEQATGERNVDHRSDIYSLAAVVYEMLAGEAPHSGPSAQAIIARLMTEEPRPLGAIRKAVPLHVEDAVRRGLEKLPADRYSTAREFADALEGKSASAPTTATRTAAATTRRHALLNPVSLAAMAVALVSTAGWVWSARRAQSDGPTVRFSLVLPSSLRLGNLVSGSGSPVAVSPDGSMLVFVAGGGALRQQIFLRSLNDAHARPLPGTETASAPFFSPDGRFVAFVVGRVLKKVSLADGVTTTLTEPFTAPLFGGTWSSDDRIVLSVGGRLVAVPAAGGAARPLVINDTAGGRFSRWPRMLADGKTVLFVSSVPGANAQQIAVARLDESSVTTLEIGGTYPLGVLDGELIYAATTALMAVPFDVAARRVTGAPRKVGEMASRTVTPLDLSRSGTLVYGTGTTEYEAVLTDLGGRVEPYLAERRNYQYVRFSPDGKRLLFTVVNGSTSDVWTYDIASRTPTLLTTPGSVNDRPEWTPDSKRVLFRSVRGKNAFELWWQAADGSDEAKPLLALPSQEIWEGLVTRDGHIVYRTGTAGTAKLWTRSIVGDTTPRRISTGNGSEWAPRLSPDEKWLAYASDANGTYQIYVRAYPGPGPATQVSVDGGDTPLWSHDGHQLIYANGQQVMSATLNLSGTPAVTARAKLFEGSYSFFAGHSTFDLSPDGKHLLLLKSVGDAETIIAYNWRVELKAQAKAAPP